MTKLKPCPICGEKALQIEDLCTIEKTWITCLKCGLETNVFKDKQSAINFWNTRSEK